LRAKGCPQHFALNLKPLFMSELRIREIVKRLFTPYQLPLLKRTELTDSTRPRRCRLDKSETRSARKRLIRF
jgi:hypothetical protein